MPKQNIIIIIMALLLTISSNAFSQDVNNPTTPEFELFFLPPESSDSVFLFNQIWETKSGDFIAEFLIQLQDKEFIDRQNACNYDYPHGILKVTKEGIPEKRWNVSGGDRCIQRLFFLETQSHGNYIFETAQMKMSNLGLIRSYNVNEDFEVISTKQHFQTFDTVALAQDHFDPRFFLFDSFESKDNENNYDGVWVCVFKGAHPNTQNEWTHDSLFFYKFDYDGNIIDIKYHELYDCHNALIFETTNHNITATETGYTLISNVCTQYNPWGTEYTWINFDRNFNFVNQYTQNPDTWQYIFRSGNATSIRLSTGDAYISMVADRLGSSEFDLNAAIVLVDTTFTVKKIVRYPFHKDIVHQKIPLWFGSVSFIDENKIFWGYNEDDNLYANPYWDDDVWINIFLMTPDLDIEQAYFYAIKGRENFTSGYELKATRDGGLVLIGIYCNRSNQPLKRCGFITKFPAEAFLGIEEAHNHGLKLAVAYPNPGHAALNIRTALQDATVEVYDVQGRKVAEQAIGGLITTLDTESWPSGMYLWNVLQDGKVSETGKWVKE